MNLEQQQQLERTTRLLIEGGAGEFLRTVCESSIDFYSRSIPRRSGAGGEIPARPDIADRIRRFYHAELPMTVFGERDEVFEDDQVGYVGPIMDLGIVKITPKLEVFQNRLEIIGTYQVVDKKVGELLIDSSEASREFALTALEVYRLQQSFGWEPQFTGYR